MLSRHYERAKRRIPRGERVRTLWLLAQAYDEQGDEGKSLIVFQRAIDEAITSLSATTLAEEGFRDQPRFRRLLGMTLDRGKAADLLFRVQWIRTFDRELRRRTGARDSRGILEVRALAPTAEIVQEGRTVELRPLDRELLVFLAENRKSPVEAITESLWKDRPGGSQVANLHSAIYRLRTMLGRDIIVRNESSYGISDELEIRYDVTAFRDAVSRLRRMGGSGPRDTFELARSTLAIYRSDFLADSKALWITRVRADVGRAFIWLSEWYARACLDKGLPDDAIGVVKNALKVEPYANGLNAIMLDALAKTGRLTELSATYDRYVTGLREELGIDPPRRLREVYATLLSSIVD
jgi:two-component SAPR family response regulator